MLYFDKERNTAHRSAVGALFILVLLSGGCGGDGGRYEITDVREVEAGESGESGAETSTAERLGLRRERPSPAPDATAAISWDVPPGWKVVAGSSMRLVTFEMEDRPGAQCWVTLLSGDAGGELPNLNRWQQEMGQPPLSDDQFAALRRLTVFGHPAPLVEIDGHYRGMGSAELPGARMFGVVAAVPDRRVFVKMVGRADDVAAERDAFVAFCESLRQ